MTPPTHRIGDEELLGRLSRARDLPESLSILFDSLLEPEGIERALVLVEDAPAKTFLKINSLFASANEALYSGSNFGIEIRDGATPEERKELLTRPGLLYVDTKGTPRI